MTLVYQSTRDEKNRVTASQAILHPRMVDNGRGQEATKRLLGTELEMALVSDQYAGYRFINS